MKHRERAEQSFDRMRVDESYREMQRDRHLNDLLLILQTEHGRRHIVELLDSCRVYKDNWTPSAEIHKFEGMRRVGLQILADIESLGMQGLELYHTAQKEYHSLQMALELQKQRDKDKLKEES